jgi:segregation and condensation protein B
MKMSKELRQAKRLAMLEATLYAAGRPVDIESLKPVLRTRSDKVVLRLVGELAGRYAARGSALEVKELPGNRVILQLKTKFGKMVRRFTKRPLMTRGPLKTLSYIAYNQPVEQMKVVADRGSHVYAHLRLMEEMGLIIRNRSEGRGVIVNTTPYFADYFGFSQDPMKTKLQLTRIFNTMKITKLDNGDDKIEDLMTEPQATLDLPLEVEEVLPEKFHEYIPAANQDS